MGDPTNPRTVYKTGNSWVLSIPKGWAKDQGIDLGDRFVLEEDSRGFRATKVEIGPPRDD